MKELDVITLSNYKIINIVINAREQDMLGKPYIKVTVKSVMKTAGTKYNWGKFDGFIVREGTLFVAIMAGKQVLLHVKGKRHDYLVDPVEALDEAAMRRSYLSTFDGSKMVVIPEYICQKQQKPSKRKTNAQQLMEALL